MRPHVFSLDRRRGAPRIGEHREMSRVGDDDEVNVKR
jgi:hypothetical protein